MADVGIQELEERLNAILEQVARGETITITRNGKPVARLVPYETLHDKLMELQRQGVLRWSGVKPDWTGLPVPSDIEEHKGKSISDLILEDRE